MAIEKFIGPTIVGVEEKHFKIKVVLRRLENSFRDWLLRMQYFIR